MASSMSSTKAPDVNLTSQQSASSVSPPSTDCFQNWKRIRSEWIKKPGPESQSSSNDPTLAASNSAKRKSSTGIIGSRFHSRLRREEVHPDELYDQLTAPKQKPFRKPVSLDVLISVLIEVWESEGLL